jgi:superfamily II DNA helicase RecQ
VGSHSFGSTFSPRYLTQLWVPDSHSCRKWRVHKGGKLQFLFIAPERSRVAGFPEMLAKRKPSLIAIDEAHCCISQWGHDFRPDYRMLGQYPPMLRPAPVIALTATATPLVQDDIAQQFGLVRSVRPRSGRNRLVNRGNCHRS